MRMKAYLSFSALVVWLFILTSCVGGAGKGRTSEGDTVRYEFSQLLTTIHHDGYTEVSIANPWKEGTSLCKYYLVNRNDSASVGSFPSDGDVIYTPVSRAVVAPSSICQLLLYFNAADAVKGTCDCQYLNLPEINARLKAGKVVDCGSSMSPSLEQIVATDAQAVLLSAFEGSDYGRIKKIGCSVVYCAEYMETTALGRAEWMKFYGMLFGREAMADSLFNVVKNKYNAIKRRAASSTTKPTVLTERLTSGTWYCPGGKSTMASMIADANANYVFSDDSHSGSLALSPETVIDKASNCDRWLFVYAGTNPLSHEALLSEYHGYAQLKAFKKGKVYQCSNIKNRYFEEISFRPDLLLRDFMLIFHPDLTANESPLRYYEQSPH